MERLVGDHSMVTWSLVTPEVQRSRFAVSVGVPESYAHGVTVLQNTQVASLTLMSGYSNTYADPGQLEFVRLNSSSTDRG